MKFIAKFWRANPQLKNGGYETSRKIEAETISAAKKLAYEIEKKAAYGSMSLRSIEEAEAPVEATTQEATEEAAPMKRFEVGKAYRTRDAYGDKSKLAYTITKRTAKTITFNDGYELQTCRVNAQESESCKAETVFPFGRSSLCPVLSADAEDASEEPTATQEVPKVAVEEAPDSKLNPMCEKCANYPTDCAGTHEQVWTGCVHRETAPDENRTFAPKKLRTMSDDRLLTAWEFTERLEDPQCPTIRGWLMDEIERRYPVDFNAWLDQDAPEDSQLRKYIMAGQ